MQEPRVSKDFDIWAGFSLRTPEIPREDCALFCGLQKAGSYLGLSEGKLRVFDLYKSGFRHEGNTE